MKRITALILALVMVAALTTGTGITVKADNISVTKDPIPGRIIEVTTVAGLANLIRNTAGTVESNGTSATITPEMCYLYGSKLGYIDNSTGTVVEDTFAKVTDQNFKSGSCVADIAAFKYPRKRAPDDVYEGSVPELVEGNYSLVVRYNNGTETIPFTVSRITGIQWPDKLTKTEYFVGDSFDLTGDYVTLVYKNGAKVQVALTDDMMYSIAATKAADLATAMYNCGAKNGGAYFVHAFTLGPVFNLPNAAAGGYDLVIRYNNEYPLSGASGLVNPGYTNIADAYNFHNMIDSSFEAGYWLAADGRVVRDGTLATDIYGGTVGISGAIYDTHKVSPVSLNGTKIYHINVTNPGSYAPKLRYRAHVQNIGWQGWFYSPNEAGTDHQSLRMEAMQIQIVNQNKSMGNIEYMGHVQNQGDTAWITGDSVVGTEGKSLRMEGVAIRFTGKYAEAYSVSYRVHVQGIGWMAWMKDGEYAGTKTDAKRMEAIEIQVTAK